MKILIVLCALASASAVKDYTGYQVWRTYPKSFQVPILRQLQQQFNLDVWSHSASEGDFEDFMVSPHHIERIQDHLNYKGLDFSVMIPELQEALEQMIPEPRDTETFDYDIYHTFDQLQTWIDSFMESYKETSSLTLTKELVGISYEGRPFSALKISSGQNSAYSFVIDCGLHAREWISHSSCPLFAKYLVDNYDQKIKTEVDMLSNIDFYIIPVANPDGYTYSWEQDRLWRKTRQPIESCAVGSCIGVDPNRNFDSNFGGVGTSDLCCSDLYHGPWAFSEKCVAAQRSYVGNITNVAAYIDFHSYSQMWMYPYGYTLDMPDRYNDLDTIATQCALAIESVHGRQYTHGQISQVIYEASGGSVDYYYDTQGIACSFAVELRDTGRNAFVLPPSEIRPTAEEAYAAIKVVGENVLSGKCARRF